MNTQELIKKYRDLQFKASCYQLALTTIDYDSKTIAPKKGSNYRNPRIAFLSGEHFSLITGQEMIDVLEALQQAEGVDELTRKEVEYQLRDINKIRYIPVDEYVKHQQLELDSSLAWEKAKNAKDYSIFEPWLKKMIESKKKLLTYRKDYGTKPDYDFLLDDYEPGMNMDKYDKFFNAVKEGLIPVIQKIQQAKQINTDFMYKNYPIEDQKKVTQMLIDYIGYDLEAGAVAESEHPFSNLYSKYDNRVTTHYHEDNFTSNIFSIIHEVGHATYTAQVKEELEDTYFFTSITSGMHESQSRLMENYLGRSEAFWKPNFSKLIELFPEQLKDVTLEDFVKAINAAGPSFIRINADELTYPLHIVIRYEIEKGLFDGSISVDNLDKVWNQKYQEYLNITPSDDAEGILQDIHWSSGSIGYFPTYALGSAYAAQFMHQMRKDIDVDEALATNRFDLIKDWLRTHIHENVGMYLPEQQMILATNEPFNPQYYIDYLTEKYTKLYQL